MGQSIAMPLYHSLISIPSALNMAFDRMFDTEYHANFYTESWADNFAKEYFKDDYEGHKDSRFSTYGKK